VGQLSSALIDVGSDGFPEDHASGTAAGIIRNDRNSIAIGLTQELHAEALMKCDGIEICRCGDRFDVPAAVRSRKLREVSEKLLCEVLPAGRRPYGDSMYISNRLGLRDKAKQVSDDLTICTNDERRVSKLMD